MDYALFTEPKATDVKIIEDYAIWILLQDGREMTIPISWYPKLSKANKQQLNNFRIIGRGSGIHWEDLDEDLSIKGFLLGIKGKESESFKNAV